jgi:hypothetical protein
MTCKTHTGHDHTHKAGCGHLRVAHEGHEDYLHDGHMHHVHGDHVDDHALAESSGNPAGCTPSHSCSGHAPGHVHGPSCGHERVPHGDHLDYLVDGHLHHAHGQHCDHHGDVRVVR